MLRDNSATSPDALGEVALFHGMRANDLVRLAPLLRSQTYRAESRILSADQPGDSVAIVQSGTVRVVLERSGAERVVLALLPAGDVVGEMSLVDRLARSASIVAHEETALLWMEQTAFWACLRAIPAMSLNLSSILSRRLRVANARIEALSTLDLPGRVARQLLVFAGEYGRPAPDGSVLIPLRLSLADLAGLVGGPAEEVGACMNDWQAAG